MDIDSTVTVECCWIFEPLTTVKRLTAKSNSMLLKIIIVFNIFVEEYLIFDQYYEEIRPFDSIH